MIKVNFLGPIGLEPIEIEAKTLSEVREKLQNREDLQPWLLNCAVAVNDEIVMSLDVKLNDGDEICLLPPVCGG